MVIPSLRIICVVENIYEVLLIDTMCCCLGHQQTIQYPHILVNSQPPRSLSSQPPQTLFNHPNLKLVILVIRLGICHES